MELQHFWQVLVICLGNEGRVTRYKISLTKKMHPNLAKRVYPVSQNHMNDETRNELAQLSNTIPTVKCGGSQHHVFNLILFSWF